MLDDTDEELEAGGSTELLEDRAAKEVEDAAGSADDTLED